MTTIDQSSTLSREVEHDETIGGTDGNPHTESASMADLDDVGGGEPVGLDSDEFDAFLEDQESVNEMTSAPVTMGAVVASAPAMDAVSMSQTARDAIGTDGVGYDAVAAAAVAIGKYAAGLAGLDATTYADIDAVLTDETARDAVIASEFAMDAVVASELALNTVAASETVMGAVGGSAVGNSLLPTTPFTDVVYTDNRNNVEFLYGLSGSTGANEIKQGEDVSGDGFLSIDTDDADSGQEVQATWTIDASLVNEMLFEAEWEETQAIARDTFYEIILDGDVIFTSPSASNGHGREDRVIDLSNEAGVVDVTFETQPNSEADGGRLTLYDNRNTRA